MQRHQVSGDLWVQLVIVVHRVIHQSILLDNSIDIPVAAVEVTEAAIGAIQTGV